MNTKLAYLFLLGVALLVGWLVGGVLRKRSVGRLVGFLLYLAGAIMFFVGSVEADDDRRFRLLAIVGLGLQVAGVVSSFSRKGRLKERSVDLWATRGHR